MMGTKEINKELNKDPALKELKQLGDNDWPWTMRDYQEPRQR